MMKILKTALAALLLLTVSAQAGDVRYDPGTNGYVATPFNLFGTTDLSGLASGACITSTLSAFTQTSTQNGSTTGGSVFGYVEFQPAGAFTPVAGQIAAVWLLKSVDGGTSFETTAACTTSQWPVGRNPDFTITFTPAALSSTSHIASNIAQLPVGSYKAVIWNAGTTAFSANNHALKLAPFMTQQ